MPFMDYMNPLMRRECYSPNSLGVFDNPSTWKPAAKQPVGIFSSVKWDRADCGAFDDCEGAAYFNRVVNVPIHLHREELPC